MASKLWQPHWEKYGTCPKCSAQRGEPCVNLYQTRSATQPKRVPHPRRRSDGRKNG